MRYHLAADPAPPTNHLSHGFPDRPHRFHTRGRGSLALATARIDQPGNLRARSLQSRADPATERQPADDGARGRGPDQTDRWTDHLQHPLGGRKPVHARCPRTRHRRCQRSPGVPVARASISRSCAHLHLLAAAGGAHARRANRSDHPLRQDDLPASLIPAIRHRGSADLGSGRPLLHDHLLGQRGTPVQHAPHLHGRFELSVPRHCYRSSEQGHAYLRGQARRQVPRAHPAARRSVFRLSARQRPRTGSIHQPRIIAGCASLEACGHAPRPSPARFVLGHENRWRLSAHPHTSRLADALSWRATGHTRRHLPDLLGPAGSGRP